MMGLGGGEVGMCMCEWIHESKKECGEKEIEAPAVVDWVYARERRRLVGWGRSMARS